VLRNSRACSGRTKESPVPTSTRPQPVQTRPWLRSPSGTLRPCQGIANSQHIKGLCKANLNSKRVHDPNRASAGSGLPKLLRCCSQTLLSHLRPHASIHADPAMASACRPSEFGFLRAHTGVLKPVAAPNESCVGPRYIFGSFFWAGVSLLFPETLAYILLHFRSSTKNFFSGSAEEGLHEAATRVHVTKNGPKI